MRENTKVILWIVVVAFVVTIFAVWGLDLRGGGGGITGGPNNVIGEVNGVKITGDHYQAVYEQLAAQMRAAAPSGRISYAQQEMIHEQTWENLITSILTEQEIEKLGIRVSDEEVVAFLRTSPPPELQQYFLDENGRFDFAAYQNALNNPEADWTAVEALARQRIPMIKLNEHLISQVHVSPFEIRRSFEEESIVFAAEYVSFPFADEDVSDYSPSEDEIREYYDAHPDEFQIGERSAVEYVNIPIEPTAGDLDDLMYTVTTLHEQLAAGEEFDIIASTYSQAPTSSVGGETGFITASQRDAEVMSQVSIMNPGQISQPIQTNDGVYIVKLLETEKEDEETRYNIQEIYIELVAGTQTVDSLVGLARDFQVRAVEKGFVEAANELGLTVDKTEPFLRNFPIAGLGFAPSVNRFAFANEEGTVSNVIGDEKNYYVCRVDQRLPQALRPLDDVRTSIESTLRFERQKRMAHRKAEAFFRKLMTASDNFGDAANLYEYTVHRPEPFRVADAIDTMPPYSPFAYAAYDMFINSISPPVESPGAYYILQVLERSTADEEEFENRAPAIAERLRQEKTQAFVSYWYDQLRENADIKDYRGGV
jgi:parvulin-like peptidyl-prolyl isomerase